MQHVSTKVTPPLHSPNFVKIILLVKFQNSRTFKVLVQMSMTFKALKRCFQIPGLSRTLKDCGSCFENPGVDIKRICTWIFMGESNCTQNQRYGMQPAYKSRPKVWSSIETNIGFLLFPNTSINDNKRFCIFFLNNSNIQLYWPI